MAFGCAAVGIRRENYIAIDSFLGLAAVVGSE
jgi:hypothetical protein